MVTTMNDDASTFDLPEYIHSRLQPQILIDFPDAEEEKLILHRILPFAADEILDYVVGFLQRAHATDERYTVRDGINIARYALKSQAIAEQNQRAVPTLEEAVADSIEMILGGEALRYTVPLGD
jgi:MoxR-like ATPase